MYDNQEGKYLTVVQFLRLSLFFNHKNEVGIVGTIRILF